MSEIKEVILSILKNPIVSGQRGWWLADCPYCGKSQHMGVIFGNRITSFVCFKCSEKGTIFRLLKHIGKLHVIRDFQTIHIDRPVENKILVRNSEIEIDLTMEEKDLPIGYRRIYSNEYLEGRNFTEQQFQIFPVGMTKIEPKFDKYLIFPIEDENKKIIGYIARTTLTKEAIIKKERGGKKYLRYKNSLNTDFSKWLYGLNELNNTETVILVEGIFDKYNVDRLMKLYDDDEIKCCACFGKKVSLAQIYRLQQKGVKNIIIIYDNDAVYESKRYSFELAKYFNVSVGFCKSKDPGDVTFDELVEIINDAQDPFSFSIGKVVKKTLK